MRNETDHHVELHHTLRRLKAGRTTRDFGSFVVHLIQRFRRDRCLRVAASLSYTSLLAMVPLLAIVFSVLSAFPVFETIQAEIRRLIFLYLAPHAGDQARDYVDTFIANTNQLTALGVIGLAVTAIMLLATIEDAFNAIWRVVRARRLHQRLLAYWTVLTLGPLLVGGAFSMTAYLFAAVRWTGLAPDDINLATRLLPFLLTAAAFTILYATLPNCRVHWVHAATGGAVAAGLFEFLKTGFGAYVEAFPAYRTIYGALSSLPLFLMWMYLVWAVVLFGGVLAAAWPEWRAERARLAAPALSFGTRLALSLKLLARLQEAQRDGIAVSHEALANIVDGDSAELQQILEPLVATRYVLAAEDDQWMLARDLSQSTLLDLAAALGLGLAAPAVDDVADEPWADRLRELLQSVDSHNHKRLGITLRALLAPAAAEAPARPGPAQLRSVD